MQGTDFKKVVLNLKIERARRTIANPATVTKSQAALVMKSYLDPWPSVVDAAVSLKCHCPNHPLQWRFLFKSLSSIRTPQYSGGRKTVILRLVVPQRYRQLPTLTLLMTGARVDDRCAALHARLAFGANRMNEVA